jgi:hypothetical protein
MAMSGPQKALFRDGIDWFDINSGTSSCYLGSGGNVTSLTGSDAGQKVWNYFAGQGLSTPLILGIMSNLYEQDARFDPEQVEIPPGGDSSTPSGPAWGIAQWTPGTSIEGYAKANNITTPLNSLLTQLNLIWAQMKNETPPGYKNFIGAYQNISNPVQAAQFFFTNFEGGGAGGSPTAALINELELYNTNNGSSVSSNNGSSGCSAPLVNCASPSSANSSLSSTRQNVICIAQQQEKLWSSEPDSYRNTGYYDYSLGNPEPWCADFASWVYKQAGYPFSGGRDGWDIPAVSGIETMAQTPNSGFTWHPANSNYQPVPGDLAIYSTAHVNILISISGSTYTFIGGDQGPSYNGNYGGTDSGSTVNSIIGVPGIQTGSAPLAGWVSPNN